MSGNSASSTRIAGSNESTAEARAGREYRGGLDDANARRTALRDTPSRRTIALIGRPSARCNRRISAQSSTASTPLIVKQGVHFQSAPRGHDSVGSDKREGGSTRVELARESGYARLAMVSSSEGRCIHRRRAIRGPDPAQTGRAPSGPVGELLAVQVNFHLPAHVGQIRDLADVTA